MQTTTEQVARERIVNWCRAQARGACGEQRSTGICWVRLDGADLAYGNSWVEVLEDMRDNGFEVAP